MSSDAPARAKAWAEAAALLALILLLHLLAFSLYHSPVIDEIFHLLAARSWAADGTLAILDGEYLRASGYTITLGLLFSLVGEDLAWARSLSVLSGALWVLALFVWLRAVAGRGSAWIAAVLFALAPTSVIIFHFVRFYASHGLVFFLGSICAYFLVTGRVRLTSPAGLGLGLGAVLAFGCAFHLQPATLTGLIGLSVWTALELGRRISPDQLRQSRFRWALAGGAVGASVLAAVVLQSDFFARQWELFRTVELWNIGHEDNFLYYHVRLLDQYSTLWALLPLATLFALARQATPAFFCAAVFGTVVLLHSLGGMKAPRYIHFAMPFFFALWGIALAEAVPLMRGLAATAVARLLPDGAWPRAQRAAAPALFAILALSFLAGMPALRESAKLARQWPEYPSHPGAVWAEAHPFLKPWLDKAEVVLTTNNFQAYYYFGRYDYQISPFTVTETDTGREFGRDPRTGRAAISTPDSLRLILDCHKTGMFLGDPFQWRHERMGTTDAVADLIESKTEPIEVPARWDLLVFYWERTATDLSPQCAELPTHQDRTKRELPAASRPIL